MRLWMQRKPFFVCDAIKKTHAFLVRQRTKFQLDRVERSAAYIRSSAVVAKQKDTPGGGSSTFFNRKSKLSRYFDRT